MPVTISVFNNKGGVGKTTTIWNLAISIAAKGKRVLMIDFDPQCNLSIATLGTDSFSDLLTASTKYPFGNTIKAFALPYIQQSIRGSVPVYYPSSKPRRGELNIVPGDFWLNNFSDILNVGTDVIGGSGLYRFILPELVSQGAAKTVDAEYDYVLIDLPPSFNTLVRSALYCSDYFLVPCTSDLFSAYCVGLIGEMLPIFINDWEQGKQRYLRNYSNDQLISQKGVPKFGGWVFNGFDTRRRNGVKHELAADAAHHRAISLAIQTQLIPHLQTITSYQAVPQFAEFEPVARIEDLNVMASDSINQNIPIKYLKNKRPTRDLGGNGQWAPNQRELMEAMDDQYNLLANHVINNFI